MVFLGLAIMVITRVYPPDTEAIPSSGAANGETAANGDEAQSAQAKLVDRPVAPFTLTERSGEVFESDSLKGEVWVASFFFTSCAADCITLNNTIARLDEELADRQIRFVSISVHPEFDTPEQLRQYAQRFKADSHRWLFLTGPMDEIRRLANESFLVSAEPATHSPRMFLVDQKGRVQGAYSAQQDHDLEKLKRRIDELLEETS